MNASYLVTGGTGGLGSAVCLEISARGEIPIIGCRSGRESEAAELARKCGGESITLELSDTVSIDGTIATLSDRKSPMRGVVLAAAPPPVLARFGQIENADLEYAWRVSVLGSQTIVASLVKHCFRKQKAGSVVAILSAAMGDGERLPMKGMGAYTIAKFGLLGTIRLLEAEFPWLAVETISPGFIETSMLEIFDSRFMDPLRQQGMVSNPEDIAVEIVDKLLAPPSPRAE